MAIEAFEILGNGETKRVKAEEEAQLGIAIYGNKVYVCCGMVNNVDCMCPVKLVSVGCARKPYFKVIDQKNQDHIDGCPHNEKAKKTPVKTINHSRDAHGDMFHFLEKFCSGSKKNAGPNGGGTGHTGGPEIEVETPKKYQTKDIEIKDKKLTTTIDIYEFFKANISGDLPYKDGDILTNSLIFNRDTFADFKRGLSTFSGYCVVFAKKGVPDDAFKVKYYDFSKNIYHLFDMYSNEIRDCKYRKIAFQLNFSSKKIFESVNNKYFSKEKYKHFIILGDWSIVDNSDSSDYLVCKCNINDIKQISPATEEIIGYEKPCLS